MTADSGAPMVPGAGPVGPDSGRVDGAVESAGTASTDPLFQGEETAPAPVRRAALLFQFFLFPLLIVVAAVGVFLLFGAIGASGKTPKDLLTDIASGGENVQKQALFELSGRLREERARVDAGKIPREKAFYAEEAFRRALLVAFEEAFEREKGAERQQALTVALGEAGDAAAVEVLGRRYEPKLDPKVRLAIAWALGRTKTPSAVPVLERLLRDPDEAVRNHAVQALARIPGDASTAALRSARGDPSLAVRSSAETALALQGDAGSIETIRHLLDPVWVREHVVEAPVPPEFAGAGAQGRADARFQALLNGLLGAAALRDPSLKPLVEALQSDEDPAVRARARDVLAGWDKPR